MDNTTSILFASLNVRGLNDRNKRIFILDYFNNSNFAIIFLQETKTKVFDESQIRKEWHNRKILINSSPSQNASGGCMILFNEQYITVLKSILSSDGRIIVADIEYRGSRYHVVNTYFPNDPSEKLCFINKLYPLLSSQYPIIFGGDMNLALDKNLDRYPPHMSNDSHSTDLNDLIKTFCLKDVCRDIRPNKFLFRRRLTKSRIDFFFIN